MSRPKRNKTYDRTNLPHIEGYAPHATAATGDLAIPYRPYDDLREVLLMAKTVEERAALAAFYGSDRRVELGTIEEPSMDQVLDRLYMSAAATVGSVAILHQQAGSLDENDPIFRNLRDAHLRAKKLFLDDVALAVKGLGRMKSSEIFTFLSKNISEAGLQIQDPRQTSKETLVSERGRYGGLLRGVLREFVAIRGAQENGLPQTEPTTPEEDGHGADGKTKLEDGTIVYFQVKPPLDETQYTRVAIDPRLYPLHVYIAMSHEFDPLRLAPPDGQAIVEGIYEVAQAA